MARQVRKLDDLNVVLLVQTWHYYSASPCLIALLFLALRYSFRRTTGGLTMRPRYLCGRDREPYLDAVDEATKNVRVAHRDHYDAPDELDELEDREPDAIVPLDEIRSVCAALLAQRLPPCGTGGESSPGSFGRLLKDRGVECSPHECRRSFRDWAVPPACRERWPRRVARGGRGVSRPRRSAAGRRPRMRDPISWNADAR